MKDDRALLAELSQLQALVAQIKSQGDVWRGCWIAQSRPGGTASKGAKSHYQIRSRTAQFDGKRSRYLKFSQVAEYESAIERGRQLIKLERRIERITQRLSML